MSEAKNEASELMPLLAELRQKEELNKELMERLENAKRTISQLETAKLSIGEVRREHSEYTEVLQIIHIHESPNGVIVTVS